MFFQTHWLIGETVAQLTEKQLPARIHHFAFCLGSVLPDLIHPYNRIPHRIKDSSPLFNRLLDQAVNTTFKSRWDFSIHLGMICHYLCDFFCLAHNETKLNNLIAHTIYEARMVGKADRKMVRNLAMAALKGNETGICDVNKFLLEKHQSYRNAAEGFENDIAFAVPVVLTVVFSLLHQDLPVHLQRIA
ncbi:MAG: zinc dependent phospholipase C family protein [Syntrophomonadaceae bacterium]|nr:zinc dependent phospholipase C family protein [Syntrophomonadaceae bacterium]